MAGDNEPPSQKPAALLETAWRYFCALIISLGLYAFYFIRIMLLHDSPAFVKDRWGMISDFMYPWSNILLEQNVSWKFGSVYIQSLNALQFFLYAIVVMAGRRLKIPLWMLVGLVVAAHLAGSIYLLEIFEF
jgi:hypothetical protein